MLALTGEEHFYFIPGCTGMRYGYRKLSEIVRHKFLRDPLNGDVYIFMLRALLARTEGSNVQEYSEDVSVRESCFFNP